MVKEDRPIGEMVGRLIDDGKAYARAEVELARARVDQQVDRFRPVAILGAAAALCAFAAVIALTMTIVLALASLLGPLAGGLAATILIGALAVLLGWLAKQRFERGR